MMPGLSKARMLSKLLSMKKSAIVLGWQLLLLATTGGGAWAEESPLPGDVIRQKTPALSASQAQSLLSSDVVDMEFKVSDLSTRESSFSTKGYQHPAYNQNVETRARSRWGDFLLWENGVDLAVYRGTHWDAAARESVTESWKPTYHNRFALFPTEKSELSLTQAVAMEQRGAESETSELWRTGLAYKHQMGKFTEFRIDALHEEKSPDSLQRPIRSEGVGGVVSQQLWTPKLKLRMGAKETVHDQEGNDLYHRDVFRKEAGLDWKALPQLGFYGGAVLEDTDRVQGLSDESLLLYELRTKWVPDAVFQMSGGLSLDSRHDTAEAASGRTQWFLRGDLQPTTDLTLFTHLRWDQRQSRDQVGVDPIREEKIFFGTGPKIRLDENTRVSAEYGLARDAVATDGQETLVEHMLSFVLSADF